ncbi:heme-binding protein 2-like [Littorina saxatilis]|uniref:Heme-binding protein 2 n=1 Tax=Littorina saxatilis TaxID=31220 RepID=A0AAN9C2Z0_9CAEN
MLKACAFLSLVGVALSLAIPSNLPVFCHKLDCPQFTVVENTTDYELRHYDQTSWVSIRKEAANLDIVRRDMFMTLFHYIDGENADQVKIPMTAPVLTTVEHGAGPNCASNFTMHFMLPHAQWAAPIKPTNSQVNIVTLPAMDVYVKSFPGYASDEDFISMAVELYKNLATNNKHTNVDKKQYNEASYDGPYQFADRHNEIWIGKLQA